MGSRERRAFRPTEHQDRARFVWLWVSGVTVRDIAINNGTSATTVYRWIRRWQREGNVDTRPRTGRPRLLSRSNCKKGTGKHSSPASDTPALGFSVSNVGQLCTGGWCSAVFPGPSSSSNKQHNLKLSLGEFCLQPDFLIRLSEELKHVFC
ncbi:hypothetical protein Pmani_004252 [Petrolisthes manimaculis]|uniref:Uncharacterized protein n=1 Tax=Petrolisthes manimaculis TaxID=1843537 RepID=A0AAE1UIM6_9EUCA|nr:hypothetical protein Pmani_004252 [Petrolisthes manimaculis]